MIDPAAMTDEQDDLTLVYAYGYKRGQDSMKAEIERLRDDNIALRELRAELILRALDESAAEIERLRAALEDIAIYGCGMLSQPTGLNQPAEQWLYKRVEEYENRARVALAGEKKDDAAP